MTKTEEIFKGNGCPYDNYSQGKDIRKGDKVHVQYSILDVTQVMYDIEEETVYYICEV